MPSFPSNGLISSFTGVDENPLSEGGIWQAAAIFTALSRPRRVSNQAANATAGTADSNTLTAISYGPDAEAYMTMAVSPTVGGTNMSVYCRILAIGANPSFYQVLVKLNTVQIWRGVAGTFAQLTPDIGQATGSGDAFGLRVTGSTLEAWYRVSGGAWALIGTRTDTNLIGSAPVGFDIQDATTSGPLRADDFGGGTVSPGGVLLPHSVSPALR